MPGRSDLAVALAAAVSPGPGSDDGTGCITARGARPATYGQCPPVSAQVPLEQCQPRVQGLEPGDPVGDFDASLDDEIRQLAASVRAVTGVASVGAVSGVAAMGRRYTLDLLQFQ
jgi:hypothetical protein